MNELFNVLLNLFQSLGYTGIVVLMAIESSFIPFPSEIVIPPAAYLASKGDLDIYLVIIAGISGSLIGALFNYYLAFYLGRFLVYKIVDHKTMKIFRINSAKIQQAEKFYLKYGNASTFFGRLIPVVRQLISLPAGFSRMNIRSFIFYTTLGSSIWVIILASLGYIFGSNLKFFYSLYLKTKILFWALGFFLILAYIFKKRLKKLLNLN